ncbi:hypothetical protein IIB34_02715, partial [PVC group bacterium]|nr:hypothetical protein [PVC group bacterium]
GGTVIIGGLMTREEREDVRKIPFFGDIPLLGNLFKTTTKSEQRKNLLFFITAKIKNNDRGF